MRSFHSLIPVFCFKSCLSDGSTLRHPKRKRELSASVEQAGKQLEEAGKEGDMNITLLVIVFLMTGYLHFSVYV